MKVLVACEESQRVCIAFRNKGHEAFSCDTQECSGNHPEWHILGDVTPVLNGFCYFTTQDGLDHYLNSEWDLIIAHPPCTYFTVASACRLYHKINGKSIIDENRYAKLLIAREFFMSILNANCDKICVENPTPMKIAKLPPYTQVIQPYQFGHPYSKRTCLWLKNLPTLKPTKIITDYTPFVSGGVGGGVAFDSKTRSKTFKGIANAMAEQWG